MYSAAQSIEEQMNMRNESIDEKKKLTETVKVTKQMLQRQTFLTMFYPFDRSKNWICYARWIEDFFL